MHTEHLTHKPAVSEPPPEFARRVECCNKSMRGRCVCAEQRQIGAFGVAHVQPCRSAQEWLLEATTDALTNGAAKLMPLCDARRCGPRYTETYSAAFPMQSSFVVSAQGSGMREAQAGHWSVGVRRGACYFSPRSCLLCLRVCIKPSPV